MIRRLAIASILSLALAGCASYEEGYRHGYADAHQRNADNDGYATTADIGYADASRERTLYMWDAYDDYGYPCSGFSYGFGYFPGRDGFGFDSRFGYDPWICNPWYGYGYPYGWYQPWPRHHHHDHHGHDNDNDHDADDPPGGWSSGKQGGVVRMQFATTPRDRSGVRIIRPVRQPGIDGRNQRDPIRRSMMQDAWRARDGDFRDERHGLPGNRSHSHDGAQK